jgi:hypothetical protein
VRCSGRPVVYRGVMTERSADKRRVAACFAALNLWNSINADAARNKWIAALAALFCSGIAG